MLVSVIIPCYNVSDYIEECLASVFSQTYEHIEVIAIDNNSTDATFKKLLELKKSLYPSLILLQESKKGACAARNKGLSITKGDWIQFLDADDILESSKIEYQIELLKTENLDEVAFISASYHTQNTKGKIYKTTCVGDGDAWLNVFVRKSGNTCANLFSKNWINKVQGWNENLPSSQETDLMMKLLFAGGKSINDENPQTIIRERASGQISQSNPLGRWNNIVKYRLIYKNEMEMNHPKVYINIKNELISFLVSSIIILAQYDKKLSIEYASKLKNIKRSLLPKYGLQPKTITLVKILGLGGFIKLKKILQK